MECQKCNRNTTEQQVHLCDKCQNKLWVYLIDLPGLHHESGFFIEPVRTGKGGRPSERSIGVNVTALDFSMATELLSVMWSWEALIREERHLTKPGLLPPDKVEREVEKTCKFHRMHLPWAVKRDWVGDFFDEVKSLHNRGMVAARRYVETPRRIPCPAEIDEGTPCGNGLVVEAEDIEADIECKRCGTYWSVIRLIAVVATDRSKPFLLDIQAICIWLGISKRQVYRIIRKHGIEKVGGKFNVHQIMDARKKELIPS